VDLKTLSEFISTNGLQTLEIIAFGWFVSTKVWPFSTQQIQRWMDLQQKRVDASEERDKSLIAALEHNTAAIEKLAQLIGVQHNETMRRLDLLGAKITDAP